MDVPERPSVERVNSYLGAHDDVTESVLRFEHFPSRSVAKRKSLIVYEPHLVVCLGNFCAT